MTLINTKTMTIDTFSDLLNMSLSIADICNHFEKAVCVLEELDKLFIVNK